MEEKGELEGCRVLPLVAKRDFHRHGAGGEQASGRLISTGRKTVGILSRPHRPLHSTGIALLSPLLQQQLMVVGTFAQHLGTAFRAFFLLAGNALPVAGSLDISGKYNIRLLPWSVHPVS